MTHEEKSWPITWIYTRNSSLFRTSSGNKQTGKYEYRSPPVYNADKLWRALKHDTRCKTILHWRSYRHRVIISGTTADSSVSDISCETLLSSLRSIVAIIQRNCILSPISNSLHPSRILIGGSDIACPVFLQYARARRRAVYTLARALAYSRWPFFKGAMPVHITKMSLVGWKSSVAEARAAIHVEAPSAPGSSRARARNQILQELSLR